MFSVIICVTDKNGYLLPLTLDSVLAQVHEPFEILVIDGQRSSHPQLYERMIPANTTDLFGMMNQGAHLAKGSFLHFLMPGEFYLSHHALTFMKEFIESEERYDLIFTGCIIRHSLAHPQLLFKKLGVQDLKAGKLPSSLQAFWFSKKAFLKLNGFNADYEVQGGFDLICRFYLDQHLKKGFMPRVLTDYTYRKLPPKKIIKQFLETLDIIHCRFGFSKMLLWWMAQNPLRLVQWWLKSIKIAFWKGK